MFWFCCCWSRNLAYKFGQNQVSNRWDIVVVVFVGVVDHDIFDLVDPRNLPLKFGQNWVSDRWNIVVAHFIIVVIHVVVVQFVVVFVVVIADPRNLSLKFGQN